MIIYDAEVKSYSEFQSVVEDHSGKLFRGQAKDRLKICPSLYRDSSLPDTTPYSDVLKSLYFIAYKVDESARVAQSQDESSVESLIAQNINNEEHSWFDRLIHRLLNIDFNESDDDTWNPFRPSIGHGFGLPSQYDEFIGIQWTYSHISEYPYGLLQHYGIRTPALDVSFDPSVALWFATHKYSQNKNNLIARYDKALDPGVVYIIDTNNKVIDLRDGNVVPIAGLRGQRQKGGLMLGATVDEPDLSNQVSTRIKVHPTAFESDHENLIHLTVPYLFPCSKKDEFYRFLLEAKNSKKVEIHQATKDIIEYHHCLDSLKN